jgi:polyisoprenoid-binding protein YceI
MTAGFSFALLSCALAANAAPHAIDTRTSTMTIRVGKSGAFSAFGHDHEIVAPIASGSADTEAHSVELRVNAAALRVQDSKGSEGDKAQIQKTMLGPEVLDAEQHREIVFKSTSAQQAGGAWSVTGNLTLHGATHPVTVTVREQSGHYVGSATIRQSDFGIKPVKVAGGTVKVKDDVRIEFDIQLAR